MNRSTSSSTLGRKNHGPDQKAQYVRLIGTCLSEVGQIGNTPAARSHPDQRLSDRFLGGNDECGSVIASEAKQSQRPRIRNCSCATECLGYARSPRSVCEYRPFTGRHH